MPWLKIAVVAAALWAGWSFFAGGKNSGGDVGSFTTEDISALAATVRQGDVLMYTTTLCPYCTDARRWLNQYGFTFTECDTQARVECAQAFDALGGNGVPYLIVKGHHMKNGFVAEEFVAALRQ